MDFTWGVTSIKLIHMCILKLSFYPPSPAVEVIESVPSVYVFLSVSTLMVEPFNVQTQKLAWGLTLMKSQASLKVIGQGHQIEKFGFEQFYSLSDLDGQNLALDYSVTS